MAAVHEICSLFMYSLGSSEQATHADGGSRGWRRKHQASSCLFKQNASCLSGVDASAAASGAFASFSAEGEALGLAGAGLDVKGEGEGEGGVSAAVGAPRRSFRQASHGLQSGCWQR